MMKVYKTIVPKSLKNIKKIAPIKRTENDRDFLDYVFTHEYSSERNDKETLIYNNKGRLVQRIKNKKVIIRRNK